MKSVWLLALTVAACASVRSEDLIAWQGQPAAKLDTHPVFLTMPVEIRQLPDGTEVRNYVNGRNIGGCFDSAVVTSFSSRAIYGRGTTFCSESFAACNNIFYIKNGHVIRYTPVGSGGAQCFTDERVTPEGWQGRALNI